MSRPPVALAHLDTRVPEAGRIRLGVKDGKAMRSLDTLRFTSPDRGVIDELANLYGGQPRPWRDQKANPPDQFEVITDTRSIPVYLPPGALSVWYEMWSGGGVQRRCDGETVQVPQTVPGGWEMVEAPCICHAAQRMECRPYSRINVIIPQVAFRGLWRLETKGWNAVHELPGMVNIIEMMAATGQIVRARIGIERRTQQTVAGKRNFVVPIITLDQSAEQMVAGLAGVTAVSIAASPPPAAALEAGAPVPVAGAVDDIIDAEIIEPSELDGLKERLDQLARERRVDPGRFVAGVLNQIKVTDVATEAQLERIRNCIGKVEAGTLTPIGFNPNGTVIWQEAR